MAQELRPAPPVQPDGTFDPREMDVWLRELFIFASQEGVAWNRIDFTGSSLDDIISKSHTQLTDIGSNTHAQIDTHIADTSNPHGSTLTQSTLVVDTEINLDPSDALSVTTTGFAATTPYMRIQGSGGAVDITANPQISAGTSGAFLMLEGQSDSNTVKLDDGAGLSLHGGSFTMKNHDMLTLVYSGNDSTWHEVSRNASASEKSWSFDSPSGASGTFYFGGYYDFAGTHNNFNPAVNFGTANASYAAHFFVVLGVQTVDQLTLRITGTSMDDEATRTAGDTEDIVIPNATAVDTYYETTKKWLGQVAISVVSGTAQNCNYGWCKYWDNNNNDFVVVGLEATWLGGANDATPDIRLRHHKSSGWTYNAGSTPTPPTALSSMNTDHVTEIQVVNNEHGAWKRDDLSTTVSGSGIEGTIIEIVTTANKTLRTWSIFIRIRPA